MVRNVQANAGTGAKVLSSSQLPSPSPLHTHPTRTTIQKSKQSPKNSSLSPPFSTHTLSHTQRTLSSTLLLSSACSAGPMACCLAGLILICFMGTLASPSWAVMPGASVGDSSSSAWPAAVYLWVRSCRWFRPSHYSYPQHKSERMPLAGLLHPAPTLSPLCSPRVWG